MKLIRKIVQAETETVFEFDCKCYKFLVKNFTSGSIFVSDRPNTDKSAMAKIESKYGQELEISEFKNFTTDKVYIIAEQAGEVEVQCLAF